MNIQIEGLNKRQKILADILWSAGSISQVRKFINSLPDQDKRDAATIMELIKWAILDEIEIVDPEVIEIIEGLK